MFVIIFFVLFAVSLIPAALLYRRDRHYDGVDTRSIIHALVPPVLLILSIFPFDIAMELVCESQWFMQLGQDERFWKVVWLKVKLGLGAFAFATAYLYASFRSVAKMAFPRIPYVSEISSSAIGIFFSLLAVSQWKKVLFYSNQSPGGVTDPIFHLNESFYLFSLPLFNAAYEWVFGLIFVAIAATSGVIFLASAKKRRMEAWEHYGRRDEQESDSRSLSGNGIGIWRLLLFQVSLFCILLAIGKQLDAYNLAYSTEGVVKGVGYTDVYARIPAYSVIRVWWVLAAALLITTVVSAKTQKFFSDMPKRAVVAFAVWVIVFVSVQYAYPWYVYKAHVKPSEIDAERSYIAYNIEFTRNAFGVGEGKIKEEEFPVAKSLTPAMIEANRSTLNNARLWDPRALRPVLIKTQEIRNYYEFNDIDVDRYPFEGESRQVMVAAREMSVDQLPEQAKTWVNLHFKFTHGHGATMNPVNVFLQGGKPDLWLRDIPAKSAISGLDFKRPEIYFGELTNQHIYVKTKEKEFDYPSGDNNAWSDYEGNGGILMSGFWSKLAVAYVFDGHRIYYSDYLTEESRLVFRRNIMERVAALAPFLSWDSDPYAVIAEGRIVWMLDGYTTSTYYPYSESFSGLNYIRNSVKVTVDAYDGTVCFYVFDESDPMIRTIRNAFPAMFKPASEMPESLRRHIRYPEGMFKVQHEVLRKYHIKDPDNFYNQEDAWDRATELFRGKPIPVEPYFVTAQLQGMAKPEFMLMNPFTVKGKSQMTGWMAALCDNDNYGKLVLYKFPKGEYIPGPQQIESMVDSHELISSQLTLWDQKGSEVIRGNMLILPLTGNGLVAFEPVYLQSEHEKIPMLTRIVGARITPESQAVFWDKNFESVLELLAKHEGRITSPEAKKDLKAVLSSDELVEKALQYLVRYQELCGAGKFKEAGEALEELNDLLKTRKAVK